MSVLFCFSWSPIYSANMSQIACVRHANSIFWNLFTFAKAENTHAERMSKTWHKHKYNPAIICPRIRAFRNCHNFDNRSKTRKVIALLVFWPSLDLSVKSRQKWPKRDRMYLAQFSLFSHAVSADLKIYMRSMWKCSSTVFASDLVKWQQEHILLFL